MITCRAVISASRGGQEAERALQVFEEMVLQGFQPNVIAYTVMISACGKGWKAARACRSLWRCEFADSSPK